MRNRFAIAVVAGLGLVAAAALPTAVLAQDETTIDEVVVQGTYNPDADVRSAVVRYADLDLTRWEGARTLLSRIRTAARTVCSPEPDRNLADFSDYRRCMTDAVDSAVYQAQSPMLDDLYGRTSEVASAY